MSKPEITEVLGNMLGAMLKYYRTRISMRDQLSGLLEEENDILRRKIELLFKNLSQYEEIIEEEWLSNITPKIGAPKLGVEMLSQIFMSPEEDIAKFEMEKGFLKREDVFKKWEPLVKAEAENKAIWVSKRKAANKLLDRKNISADEKENILEQALTEAETPEDFLRIVIAETNRLPSRFIPSGLSEAVEAYEGVPSFVKQVEDLVDTEDGQVDFEKAKELFKELAAEELATQKQFEEESNSKSPTIKEQFEEKFNFEDEEDQD